MCTCVSCASVRRHHFYFSVHEPIGNSSFFFALDGRLGYTLSAGHVSERGSAPKCTWSTFAAQLFQFLQVSGFRLSLLVEEIMYWSVTIHIGVL